MVTNSDKIERIRELVGILDRAARVYEQEDREIMSNFEYDALYDELVRLEKETGFVLANSPTQRAGYEVLSELPKERHESPMLSLDKTKEVGALADFLGEHEGMLSWKMDGLTIVLTYRDGELVKAVTRGNGPILADHINATITIKTANAALKVHPVSNRGEKLPAIPSKYEDGRLSFTTSANTIYYIIE